MNLDHPLTNQTDDTSSSGNQYATAELARMLIKNTGRRQLRLDKSWIRLGSIIRVSTRCCGSARVSRLSRPRSAARRGSPDPAAFQAAGLQTSARTTAPGDLRSNFCAGSGDPAHSCFFFVIRHSCFVIPSSLGTSSFVIFLCVRGRETFGQTRCVAQRRPLKPPRVSTISISNLPITGSPGLVPA